MRNLFILLVVMLCSSCAQLPPVLDARPKQAKAVVLDIDGTLTPHKLSIFEARTDAAKAVRIFHDNGYEIIYLTARSRWAFQAELPSWLDKHGFPEGNLHVAQTDEDRSYPDVFKRRILEELKKRQNIEFAYGDSHTDFVAYALAGIRNERVFALLPTGEDKCQPGDWRACLTGWTEHLDFITKSVQSALEK